MKEFKGTKGEWAWQKFGEWYSLVAQHGMREIIIHSNRLTEDDGDYRSVVTTNNDGLLKPIHPNQPNAKLIAAAPQLLEALGLLMKEYDEKGQLLGFDVDIARKALKKAL